MTAQQEDARLALLAAFSENAYSKAPQVQRPPVEAGLAALGWDLRGYLTAVDDVRDIFARRLYYGIVAESIAAPGTAVVVVRGTENFVEWIIDAEFFLQPHPSGGHVEDGFYGVYRSIRFLPPAADAPSQALWIADALGTATAVTVVGHSLGAAIATYLALTVAAALPQAHVALRAVASPRPGDTAFARMLLAAVPDSVAYDYEPDLVPQLPAELLGYASLPSLVTLPKDAAIPDNPLSNHHALTYARLLDPTVAKVAGWNLPRTV